VTREQDAAMLDKRESAEPAEVDERSPLGQVLAQQAAVAEMAQRALDERNLSALLDETCVLVRRVLGTELVDVLELQPGGDVLRVVAGVGWRPGIVGQLTVPSATGSQSGLTLASGGPVIAHDLATEGRFAVSETLRDHDAVAGISVRIGSAGAPYGVLAAFATERRQFTHDEASFLQSLANVLGSAVARLSAEAELRRSRDELAAIVENVADGITVQDAQGRLVFANDAAARLSGFASAAEFVNAPIERVMAAFELLAEDGGPLPLEQLPGRVALTTGRTSPATAVRFRIRATGEERWSLVQAAPVHAADGHVVKVVNVFRDVTAQRQAEFAHAMLAEVSGVMSGTLALDRAARRLAELCVPRLADFCVVDLLEADGSVTTAAIAHVDPERAALGWRLRELRPVVLGGSGGPGKVIADGRTETYVLTEELLRGSIDDSRALQLLLDLNLGSYVCVALQGRARPVGALTLVMAESGRRFNERDVGLAEEIGGRAGVALENAQLYGWVNARRAELETVIGAMDEAVLLFDERGELRLSNRAAERLFGGSPPASLAALRVLLTPLSESGTLDAEPAAVAAAPTQAANMHRSAGLDFSMTIEGERRLAGSDRWLEINVHRPRVAVEDAAPAGSSVVVLRDVTEERTAQLARDAFIGVLSHELRTPITTIFGGSELLSRSVAEGRQAEITADIRAEAERLARLVEDLLVMSRVERGGVEIGDEPVLLQRVLPPLVESLSARWPALRVALELPNYLPAVRGDVTYLEQVLRNLLTNAVRYGDGLAGGVEVTAHEQDGRVSVRVLDRGSGPGTDSPDRLFDLFYRAPSARLVPGGAGIGLFVCRQLVHAMGGRIWAAARDGGGTEFGFELPVVETDALD
jgi:PAS domain S-box-containing protein